MDAFRDATMLVIHPSGELLEIIFLTLKVSGIALLLATIFGLAIGATVALRQVPFKGIVIALLNAFMGLPPVVAGLFLYVLLSRSGPLGFMGILYSPTAMITAQFILALPIVAALTQSAVMSVDPSVRMASLTLGASTRQLHQSIFNEARFGIFSAVVAAFGRVMAEVGAVLIVGGNIAGHTRVMTTAIAMETDKGDFKLALALGMVLLLISIVVNMVLYFLQKRSRHGT